MKKKKTVFLVLFAALLSVMSLLICSLYKEAGGNQDRLKERVEFYLAEDIGNFVLGAVQKADASYQPLRIADSIQDEKAKQSLREQMAVEILKDYQRFAYDDNFDYWIRDTKSKTIFTNQKSEEIPDFSKDSLLYVHLIYDEQGEVFVEGDVGKKEFTEYPLDRFLVDENGFYLDERSGNYFPASALSVEQPKHMEVFLRIPQEVIPGRGVISNYVYSASNYAPFLVTCILTGTFVLALFLLCYPIAIVKQVQPFQSAGRLKGEIAFILFPLLLTFAIMGMMMMSSYSISGALAKSLDTYGIWRAPQVVLLVNFILWILLFLLIAISLYYLKYIFACGFFRYLKQDTLTAWILKKARNAIHELMIYDLDHYSNRRFIKIVILNLIALIVCNMIWGFGAVFLYSILFSLWMKRIYVSVKKDYQRLKEAAHELAEGKFEQEIYVDAGVFSSLKEELNDIRKGFEKAVREETKSQNMKTELITNVSHDLKTPLTGIRNYVELLADETLEEASRREYIKMLGQYTSRLSNLIEDLFEVSKVNSGNLQLEVMELDLSALLQQVHAECSDILEEKQLQLIEDLPSKLPVCLDGGKTYRIFENLFTNIGKYALASTRVYLEVREREEDVVITFKNISEAPLNFHTEEIMERFVRGDKSRHTSGSGLGLAIVKSFTEAQKGSFSIETDGDLFRAIVILPKRLLPEEA